MRDGQFIVDADGHVMDWKHRCYDKYLPEQTPGKRTFYPDQGWDRRQTPYGDLGRDPETPHAMLADYDQEGIDLAILYPTQGLGIGQIRDFDRQADLCRAYNNWVSDWCKQAPDRLKAVAIVPTQDPTEACRELNRAVSELGAVGVMLPTWVPGRNVADREFWPIWGEAEKLGIPVALHATGGETSDVRRFDDFLKVHIWSHVPEQMLSVTAVVLGGIFEVFKDVRVGFMESGAGWVPFWTEHMDGEFEKRPYDAPLLKAKPSEYMRCGRAYYACEPEERTIPFVANWIGDDQLLYASDYPHWDGEWPNTVSELMERDDLTADLKRKIMCENALRFYSLNDLSAQ